MREEHQTQLLGGQGSQRTLPCRRSDINVDCGVWLLWFLMGVVVE